MSELKSRSVETHQLWVACGRPRSGPVLVDRCRARAVCRCAIKCKRRIADARISNELHELLLSKDCVSFWNAWKRKVGSKPNLLYLILIDGCACRHSSDIANVFENAM